MAAIETGGTSSIYNLSCLILNLDVVSGLIEEIAVEIGNGVTDGGIKDAEQGACHISVEDILDEACVDFPDVPIAWNIVLARGDIVKTSLRQVADANEFVGRLGDGFAMQGVRMFIDMSDDLFPHGVDKLSPSLLEETPHVFKQTAREEQVVVID